jgi:hypothetical protein
MARRGSEVRRLPAQILVRLTVDQHSAISERALAAQVSCSTWARFALAKLVNVDPGRTKIRAAPPPIILELANLRGAVAQLYDALVEASNASLEGGQAFQYVQIEDIIREIKAAMLGLRMPGTENCAVWFKFKPAGCP